MNQREIAYRKIRDAITYGELKPGEQLVEKRTCELFGIGRTPLREALRQLQAEGYVEIFPQKGAIIKNISINDIKEIYNIVAILEGYAAEMASTSIKTSEKKELIKINSYLKPKAMMKDYRGWLENNAKLHGFLSKASRNNHLYNTINDLRRRIHRYRFIAITIPGHIDEYIEQHQRIVDAVVKGESKLAANEMQRHVLRVKEILVEFLERFPGF